MLKCNKEWWQRERTKAYAGTWRVPPLFYYDLHRLTSEWRFFMEYIKIKGVDTPRKYDSFVLSNVVKFLAIRIPPFRD